MEADVLRVLIDADRLEQRVRELAADLTETYRGRELTVVVVARGALFFAVDLLRRVPLPLELDTVSLHSYIGTESSGKVTFRAPLGLPVEGRHVLIVEDILDSGRTLAALHSHLTQLGAADVRSCVLLVKDCPRAADIEPDYYGFPIPDEFVIGYGLDYCERYRNLPYVGILKPEIYAGIEAPNPDPTGGPA